MTFIYESDNTKDNEQRSLRPDENGDVARNITSVQLQNVIVQLEAIATTLASSALVGNIDGGFANSVYPS
ncbi:hypothetical protein KDA08_05690 [Candidatus Saccharibacteria bacterium]|nr:hypothetical protein [Candidatus Saccharibacteria bacterium]